MTAHGLGPAGLADGGHLLLTSLANPVHAAG